MEKELNPFKIVQEQIEEAGKVLNLSDEVIEYLKWPKRVLSVRIPVKMDDGSIKIFTGFRS